MIAAKAGSFLSHLILCEFILLSVAYIIFLEDMWTYAKRVILLFWLALCVLFPYGVAFLLLSLGVIGNKILQKMNLYKISKNQMPLTYLDIAMTIRNPSVLFYLLGYSKYWMIPLVVCLAAIVGETGFVIFKFFMSLSEKKFFYLIFIMASFTVIFLYFKKRLLDDVSQHFSQLFPFGNEYQNHMGWVLGNWEFDTFSRLSQHLGMPAFILYTQELAKKENPVFFKTSTEKVLPANDLITAAKHYVPSLPAQSLDYQYPNIVVMQCESVFDPSRAFVLADKFKNSIFTKNQYTQFVCPLRVNIVGGGSWISEFEFLAGLDARLFGYMGFYSHVTLAPYIISAFPEFLKVRGYYTNALYPALGKFYNAQNAYCRYGFKEFLDSRALNLPHEWISSDVDMANAFIEKTFPLRPEPFFSFIVTNGAHSPYSSENSADPIQWKISFQADCESIMNATLNEYVKLLEKTDEAIQLILDRLTKIETTTGRPFVFLLYGDHQPFDFKGNTYDKVRSAEPKNQTFVHMMSSVRNLSLDLKDEVPLSLLPSIVSAVVVNNYEDLYALPNFYLYEKHGSNNFPGLKTPKQFGIKSHVPFSLKESKERAQAVATLQNLNIINPFVSLHD